MERGSIRDLNSTGFVGTIAENQGGKDCHINFHAGNLVGCTFDDLRVGMPVWFSREVNGPRPTPLSVHTAEPPEALVFDEDEAGFERLTLD
jgi:cold shock CspA family protein